MPVYCYTCECGRTTEVKRATYPRRVPARARCAGCGRHAPRDIQAEVGHGRKGDLPDWVSINAGVSPLDVARCNRDPGYRRLGVTFDRQGRAHVPGNNRTKFLKYRGMTELSGTTAL